MVKGGVLMSAVEIHPNSGCFTEI